MTPHLYIACAQPGGEEPVPLRTRLLDALATGTPKTTSHLYMTCGIACGAGRSQVERLLGSMVELELVQRQGQLWWREPEVVPVYDRTTGRTSWQVEGMVGLAGMSFGNLEQALQAWRGHICSVAAA